MADNKSRKPELKAKGQNPRPSNDQTGENAGEGRYAKDMDRKGKKKQ